MLATLLLLACVSRGDHELIQVQLDATRTALSARNAACYEGFEARDAQIAALEAELAQARASGAALDERREQLTAELEAQRGALAALATSCAPPPAAAAAPLVQASAADLAEALALRSRLAWEQGRRQASHAAIAQAFEPLRAEGRLELLEQGGRTLLRIPAVQLFDEGRVSVSPRGELLLAELGRVLATLGPAELQVAVHSDAQPYHSAEHASSWEFCFAEAMAVLRALREAAPALRLSAAAHAGERPLAEDATPEGLRANRRVELVFVEDPAAGG